MIQGITESVYNTLLALLGQAVLNNYFSSTPQMDDRGNYFYAFTGYEDDWTIFLVENDLEPAEYELGLFTLINSQQGSGTP